MSGTDLDLLKAYRLMLLARTVDEREWMLNRQGKVPFVVSCQGQEATQVALGLAVRPGVDHIFPYYRDTGLVLALGMTPVEVFLNLFAKATDPNSGGRQMPNHWAHRDLKIYSHSSPVATQIHMQPALPWPASSRLRTRSLWSPLGRGPPVKAIFTRP